METLYFWNDTQKLTLTIEPLDPVEPPPQFPDIPSGIKLFEVVNGDEISIATNIKLEEYANS